MIKDLGERVVSVWETLRPVTRKRIVGEMQSQPAVPQTPRQQYDAHADWELSKLLSAVDEQARSSEVKNDASKSSEIALLANTCVRILEAQSASAEIFIQLAGRAIRDNDYDRLDRLADLLHERYSAAEIAEIVRQTEAPQIRAIAYETLAMLPVGAIVPLLDDSLYADIAAATLEQKAFEFDSEEARDVLEQLENEAERGE